MVYVIDSTLQSMQPHHKWSDPPRVVVYLGTPQIHSNNVVLVLPLKTGLVIPQFHVDFDKKFQTVGQEELSLQWKLKAGFITPR